MKQNKPDPSKIPGFYEPNEIPELSGINLGHPIISSTDMLLIKDALTPEDCDLLVELFDSAPISSPVSVQGGMDAKNDSVGSVRTTMWSEKLAESIYKNIEPFIRPLNCDQYTPTDWWQNGKIEHWEPDSMSPLLRFMRYQKSGQHYPHYDAGYIYPDPKYRTLKSVVIYLSTNEDGGETRFIDDPQEFTPIWDRDHADWDRPATPNEVYFTSKPQKGNILIFDHRLCHDVSQYFGENDRIIIRGDIIYKG